MLNRAELRLSAQRALLGRIHPEMRLVKIKALGTVIVLSIVVRSEVNDLMIRNVMGFTVSRAGGA
jgi:hypothetical protein